MIEFHDRAPKLYVDDDDHSTPLTKETAADANARVREATPDYRHPETEQRLRTLAVQRHRARNAGRGDFETVGEYLAFVTGSSSSS